MAIWRGVGGSGESTNDSTVPTVTALLVDAEAARDAAQLAETNAETAASNAASSASTASTQASNAATSATNAASSASSASTSATNAASSASTASTQASNAASSASAASTSASNAASSASSAASSASTATTKASEASTSATNAASSATAAASSASTATTQASNAASSASAAATSASNAATSESNAASSASAAAASYDSFDDRYLGAKSSAPTLDNDGNALLTGALYFNTSTNEMKVWSGSAWLNAYASLSGALLATNNLSDLNNTATARTNLGLGTAATQNSTAFATAAQGANADTAYGWGNHALAGYAADSAVVKLTGDQTIAGTKTFSSTISGSISGNAGTVTNGVYTTGDQTIAGTKTFSSNPILSAGTANGVVYLNGSKVATSGSALTFDGTNFATTGSGTVKNLLLTGGTLPSAGTPSIALRSSDNVVYHQSGSANNIVLLDSSQNTMYSVASTAHIFAISNSEQMRLTSTGFGLGTTTMTRNFNIGGSNAAVGMNMNNTGTSGRSYSIFSTNSSASAVGALGFYDDTAGAYRMVIDSSGRLLVGTTTASGTNRLLVDAANSGGDVIRAQNTGGTGSRIASFANGSSTIGSGPNFYMQNVTGPNTWAASMQMGASAEIIFLQYPNSSWSERARIDSSGNLLVGTTNNNIGGTTTTGINANATGVLRAGCDGGSPLLLNRISSDGTITLFQRQGTTVGTISVTGSATAYNTSSDYRLKEDIQPMTGALTKVAALKPVTYKWKSDGSDGEGFIAHELAEVVPQCVTGEKDAVDEDGNPVYQGIDTSFLVATLTAAIQEQQAIIEQLKARLDAANL